MFTPVTSSNIEALAHDEGVLKVKFKSGSEYHYEGVPSELFEELLSAESVGKAFNQKVKSRPDIYPYHSIS